LKPPSGLCICLAEPTLAENVSLAAKLRKHADLLELRADALLPEEAGRAGELVREVDLPVILSVRRRKDGGAFSGPERERLRLLERLVPQGFAFVDLEHDLEAHALDRRTREAGVGVIRSFHDPAGVPFDLSERMQELARSAEEIPRATVTPRGSADLLRLLEAFERLARLPKVLSAAGDYGFPARMLAPKLGSLFCAAEDPETADELYRCRQVSAATRVFGVIGNPVMHSLSPVIHNKGYAALGLDAIYLPFLVDDLEPFFRAADKLDIQGLSVTVPHKIGVMSRLARRDGSVSAIGACNTLHRRADGKWEGTNTDAAGFLSPLLAAFGGTLPQGLGATVIGAGGAARAVVHALAAEGVRVLILNRTPDRAQALAEDMSPRWGPRIQVGPLDGLALMNGFNDLIVQTTKVGMAPEAESDPLPGYSFSGRETVYDLVYVPAMTTFLKRAKAAGCPIIPGSQMLLAQAFEQFRIFTGSAYPRDAAQGIFESVLAD
jgi:3-dehydroquinate dehydratase/shikimate dehydrogenase